MSRRKASLGLVGLLIVALIGLSVCASQAPAASPIPKDVEVTEKGGACGSSVGVDAGDTLVVGLEGNPSTGFTWELGFYVPAVIRHAGEPDITSHSNLMGADATYTFRLLAVGEGEVTLRFIYHRPFEQGAPPAKTCEVTVTVK